MFRSTLAQLRCPRRKGKRSCEGELRVENAEESRGDDLIHGLLSCGRCSSRFPVLAGVAVLVHDVREYLLGHVKGVSRIVPDAKIPADLRKEFRAVREEVEAEGAQHIEEDLEADRVTALYLMTHFLRTASPDPWWKPQAGTLSPVMDEVIRKYWDQGPLTRISSWQEEQSLGDSWVEIGCGVGGLGARLDVARYLGVDSSFASIALARHVVLGAPYAAGLNGPADLLQGQTSRKLPIHVPAKPPSKGRETDYVVGDVESLPVASGAWDVSASLNMIDMMEEPAVLPRAQKSAVRDGGTVIQSCPYIWHPEVAKLLRSRVPKEIQDSARAVEWLYEKEGLKVEERAEHVPWLFFKHLRQMEIYDVHVMRCRRSG